MKVAIYARVSTKTKGQDVENQLMVLRDYCQKLDYTIYNIYTDQESGSTSVSGTTGRNLKERERISFD